MCNSESIATVFSIVGLGYIDAMPTPKLPWYQFSLRSLLLLTVFVAVLCSIGVCTHWLGPIAIGMLALAGITGRIVAGTRLGFVLGVMFGMPFFLIQVVANVSLSPLPLRLEPSWQLGVSSAIGAILGGVAGGIMVRPRSPRP